MGECELDKFERADLQDEPVSEFTEYLSWRRKITDRKIMFTWKCEFPSTGENGNDIASGYFEAKYRY